MTSKSTILAVDDTPESLAFLAELLVSQGYRALPADSGELALAALASAQESGNPPDLILLDMRMENLSGLEVLRRIKAKEGQRDIPVILMSAYADVGDWVEGLRLGAVDYVTKPFLTEDLLTRIKTHLSLNLSHRTLREQARELQDVNDRLRASQEDLELRIEERTAELERANVRLGSLWKLSSLSSLKDQELHNLVLSELVRMTQSSYGFFGFMDPSETIMTIHSWSGQALADCAMVDKPLEYRIADVGVWGEAVRKREVLLMNDFSVPHDAKRGYPAGHVELKNLLVVPIFSSGKIRFLVAVANRHGSYDAEDTAQISAFMAGVEAILDRRGVEARLRVSERKYHTVADFTWDLETWRDTDGRYLFVSPSCERITGYAPQEFLDDPDLVFHLVHPEDRACLEDHFDRYERTRNAEPGNVEFRIIAKDGSLHWISHYCREILEPSGVSLGRRGSNRDVTERRLAEDRVEDLLGEKELLLREVHHRIKNNMNSMTSLLSLQAGKSDDPGVAEILKDAQRRLASMGVLYERLYRSEQVGSMSVVDYLPPLAEEIVGTFPSAVPVEVQAELEPIVLPVKVLQPLGIIVNELITNSMKYAFVGRERGTIRLQARREGSRVVLSLEDDGRGVEGGVDLDRSGGFGFTLVKMLVEQLDGSIRAETGKGTVFTMEFSAEAADS